ncbi:hypothetical protein [Vibrio cholerae]|uniref:hypothetical protein n=1 Tax=Vibrio cholerae TaxID=666 RepID=UPI0029C2F660|nr:hypothetical protein [Vibrio cholerae]MDX5049932.1 hypothetical protein [Vibrio cholerae]
MKTLTVFNVKRFVIERISIQDFPLLHEYMLISNENTQPKAEHITKIMKKMKEKGYSEEKFNEIIKVFSDTQVAVSYKILSGSCNGHETIWAYVMGKIDSISPSWHTNYS